MTIFEDSFSAANVISSCRVTNGNLQSIMKRNVIVGQPVEGEEMPTIHGGSGRRRKFTFRNIMQIAVATEAMNVAAILTVDAFKAAEDFAYRNEVPKEDETGEWATEGDAPKGEIPSFLRIAGLPYPKGETLLIISGGDAEIIQSGDGKVDVTAITVGASGFAVLDLGLIFRRVATRLGYDAQHEVAEAYGLSA